MIHSLTLTAVASLALLIPSQSATADIVNGGLENGSASPSGWGNATGGTATFNYITGGTAGEDVHTGTDAATIESPTGDNSRWFTTNSNLASVVAGEDYYLTVWVKVEDANDEDVSIKIDWFDGGSQNGSSSFFSLPGVGNTDGWEQMVYQLTVPDGIDGAKPVIYFSDGGDNLQTVGAKLTFDDVSVTPVPEPGSLGLLGMGLLCILSRKR